MALGSRVGSRGSLYGSVVGSSGDDEGVSMQGVTKDATSGIYCPATLAEWNQTMAAAGIGSGSPSVLWLCQEASGNLADSIGSFTGTAGGAGNLYQQAVTGWSRVAVGAAEAATANWTNSAAGLPDPSAASLLGLVYAAITATPTAVRGVSRMATTTTIEARVTTTPAARVVAGANTATGSSTLGTGVRPWVTKHNVTGSSQALYTDQDKVIPTFTALSGKQILLGNGGVTPPTIRYLYAVWFFNAAAELTDAQIKTLLQTLGWAPLWT